MIIVDASVLLDGSDSVSPKIEVDYNEWTGFLISQDGDSIRVTEEQAKHLVEIFIER